MATVSTDSNLPGDQPIEIRDASGRLLGHFTPAGASESELYELARKHFDPTEKDARKQSAGRGVTTAEVLKHLQSLEQA